MKSSAHTDQNETLDELVERIAFGTVDLVPKEALKAKLATKRPLKVKLGVDPTSPDLHLGHAVPLKKMRQLQDLGHTGILIIGNGTARIGDPSGRNTTRPTLSEDQIKENAQTYVDQAFKILDPAKTKIVYNDEWISDLNLESLLTLMSSFTVARILERDDFQKRFKEHLSISLHEFMYPVLQAYDSVVIEADIELGGTDQLFNLLAGRELMEKRGMEPQVALTLPLLVGTDGMRKMSKSYGNYIGLTDSADDMYGKAMSIPDELIPEYYTYAANLPQDEIRLVQASCKDGSADPYALKRRLAAHLVEQYHGPLAAEEAAKHFDAVFKEHARPDAKTVALTLKPNEDGHIYVPALLVELGLASTNSEARRLIQGGGVKINDEVIADINVDPQVVANAFVQVGKRKAAQIKS